MNFEKYLEKVSEGSRQAIKIEWLNQDETVNFEFTNQLYDINVDVSVNYQNGCRRTCSITLNNDKNQFPVNFNGIWFGQKFKVWMGIYIDDTPYYFPQGVFYVTNPTDTYQPSTKNIKINGVDKWAFLDGTLHGKLSGTYQTNIGVNLYNATKSLLKLPITQPQKSVSSAEIGNYFSIYNGSQYFGYANEKYTTGKLNYGIFMTMLRAKQDLLLSFDYMCYLNSNTDVFQTTIFDSCPYVDSYEIKGAKTSNEINALNNNYRNEVSVGDLYRVTSRGTLNNQTLFVNSGDVVVCYLINGTTPLWYRLNPSTEIYKYKGKIRVTNNFVGSIKKDQLLMFYCNKDKQSAECSFSNICVDIYSNVLDPITPFMSPGLLRKTTYVLNTNPTRDDNQTYYTYNNGTYTVWSGNNWDRDKSKLYIESNVIECPYTAKVERGKTYADVLLEYATILCANIYYDVNGRLVVEPISDTADDITDTDKEILWNYTVDEKTLLGLTQTYNFDKVYNDIIVLGNIINGHQFKARVQNKNPMSDTCIQKIGLKTKEPFEDNQYYSDEQCKELAMYYAKVDTIMQKSGSIDSLPLYHIDVNKLVSVSTPNNRMSKELFLITGFSLSSSGTMSLNITSVNILKDFSVVEVDVYE